MLNCDWLRGGTTQVEHLTFRSMRWDNSERQQASDLVFDLFGWVIKGSAGGWRSCPAPKSDIIRATGCSSWNMNDARLGFPNNRQSADELGKFTSAQGAIKKAIHFSLRSYETGPRRLFGHSKRVFCGFYQLQIMPFEYIHCESGQLSCHWPNDFLEDNERPDRLHHFGEFGCSLSWAILTAT